MTDKAVLLSDIEFVEMHSDDWERIERESFEIQKQPQLNENQKMVLGELKVNTDYHKFNKFQAVYWMLTNFINYPDTLMAKAYKKLTQNELEQVFQVFSQWAQEQEEKQ